jgi:hypothetical protein
LPTDNINIIESSNITMITSLINIQHFGQWSRGLPKEMPKHPRVDTSDLETDSDDESRGFSQKYQLYNYEKKYKQTKANSTEDNDDNDTKVKKSEDNDDNDTDTETTLDDATLVAKRASMMAKSEEWLKWLRQEYSHKNALDHKWPGQNCQN